MDPDELVEEGNNSHSNVWRDNAIEKFIASKRAQFGIKVYKLCKSSSGYCIRFKIYVGQDKTSVGDVPASESVVMEMA
ncbi:hypothetical protein J437_LFUL010534 [Ladona fulva]|uniref:PiggyBac transposable element-derived protein domain-containing protein n=1 Tax=Ladona fulva TaxID=123851 RepID=A0A8K0P7F0_LADFU|nr:hypothetical protein J437_LFUL010534 [Ladona fulva]